MTVVGVTVSDENGNEYVGILCQPGAYAEHDAGDTEVPVFVLFDGSDNGFGHTSPEVLELKPIGNGKYGA